MRRSSGAGRHALAALMLAASAAAPAYADFKVKLPDAESGEWEVETVGSYGQSGNPAFNNEQIFVHEIEHGFNDWYRAGLEFETGRDPGPGNHLKFQQLTFENWFVFGEPGQYWLDSALFAEYGHAMLAGTPDEITLGPLLRKEIGPTINTVNLFLSKDVGPFSQGRVNFSYAVESRLALGTIVEPGIQAYGSPGAFGHFAPISEQDHRIGPQLFTRIANLGPGTLKMNGGILFGLTPGEPRHTLRWQLEYELHF